MHDLALMAATAFANEHAKNHCDPIMFGSEVALVYLACRDTQYHAGDEKAKAAALAALSIPSEVLQLLSQLSQLRLRSPKGCPTRKRKNPMFKPNDFTAHLAAALAINAAPSAKTKRTRALEFAFGMMDADTVEFGLESAVKILAFLEEGDDDFDLRMRALSAASTVAMRSEGDSQANLIAHARAFLAFLNGATSSASPTPCASAEPRTGVE